MNSLHINRVLFLPYDQIVNLLLIRRQDQLCTVHSDWMLINLLRLLWFCLPLVHNFSSSFVDFFTNREASFWLGWSGRFCRSKGTIRLKRSVQGLNIRKLGNWSHARISLQKYLGRAPFRLENASWSLWGGLDDWIVSIAYCAFDWFLYWVDHFVFCSF